MNRNANYLTNIRVCSWNIQHRRQKSTHVGNFLVAVFFWHCILLPLFPFLWTYKIWHWHREQCDLCTLPSIQWVAVPVNKSLFAGFALKYKTSNTHTHTHINSRYTKQHIADVTLISCMSHGLYICWSYHFPVDDGMFSTSTSARVTVANVTFLIDEVVKIGLELQVHSCSIDCAWFQFFSVALWRHCYYLRDNAFVL